MMVTAFKPNQPIELESPNGKIFKGSVIGDRGRRIDDYD